MRLLANSYEDPYRSMNGRHINSWSASTSRSFHLRVDWDLGKLSGYPCFVEKGERPCVLCRRPSCLL